MREYTQHFWKYPSKCHQALANVRENEQMSANMKSDNSDTDSSEEFYDAEGPR